MTPDEAITVVIPTSPIVTHPSTWVIDEIYAQTRKHLPQAEIIVLADGVHPEELYLRERYEEYLRKLSARCFEWSNVELIEFGPWLHQSGMLNNLFILNTVKTPLVFWSEHDIPLNDLPINWQGIVDTLLNENFGGIRFELTGDPPKRNEVKGELDINGIHLVLSTQFVNWPQVFRLDYFKELIESFGPDARTYLECTERDDMIKKRWSRYRYGIYSPEGEIRRCYHSNGREKGNAPIGKPFIEIDGHRRHVYSVGYKPGE